MRLLKAIMDIRWMENHWKKKEKKNGEYQNSVGRNQRFY
jgi:hypothetical protein